MISVPVRAEIIFEIQPVIPETFSISVMPEKNIIIVHILSIAEAAPETEFTIHPALRDRISHAAYNCSNYIS